MAKKKTTRNRQLLGSHPANIPEVHIMSKGGLHFYASSCCKPPEHYGTIVTAVSIPPSELGCANNIPIAMGPRTPQLITMGIDTFLSHVGPTDILGTADIGNNHTPTSPSKILYNAALVTELERVKFIPTTANPLVANRLFKLSHFEVCYFKSVDCKCQTDPEHGDSDDGQTGGHGATHGQQKSGLKLVHYHLLLAECTHRGTSRPALPDPLETVNVTVESSAAYAPVKAGRLLRLTGTAGVYQGATILALNNVA